MIQICETCKKEIDGFTIWAIYHHSKKRVFCSNKCFREWITLYFDKQKKGTFAWAYFQLKEGQKVKRPCWQEDSYWVLGVDESIQWNGIKSAHIHLNQINATDFEIYKEPQFCLSNNLANITIPNTNIKTDIIGKPYIKKFITERQEKLIRIKKRLLGDGPYDCDIALDLINDLINDKDNLIGDKFK